jgi:hypothetical protein
LPKKAIKDPKINNNKYYSIAKKYSPFQSPSSPPKTYSLFTIKLTSYSLDFTLLTPI